MEIRNWLIAYYGRYFLEKCLENGVLVPQTFISEDLEAVLHIAAKSLSPTNE